MLSATRSNNLVADSFSVWREEVFDRFQKPGQTAEAQGLTKLQASAK
jgi:hypothetical protein